MEYTVDVVMLVYNQEKFIKQAIESVVSQKTNFKFRVFIGEDCSKDTSRSIVEEYAKNFPDIIVPVLHEKNMGGNGNLRHVLSMATSKYVAICEGDDYWTDDLKLQRQVDFMEANPDYSICFTDVKIVDEHDHVLPDTVFAYSHKDEYTIADIIESGRNIIPTPTLFFRNILPRPLPEFFVHMISGDFCLHLMLGDMGKAKRLATITAVYRNHQGGVSKGHEFISNEYIILIRILETINKYLHYKYDHLIRKRLFETSKTMLIFGSRNKKGIKKFKYYLKTIPNYLKYSDKISIKEIAYFHCIIFFPSLLKMWKS